MMNGGRGEGWGLMEGEGVLGRRRPCARSSFMCALSSSCPWAFVMRGWRVVVRGWGSSVVGWVVVRGGRVVDCSWWGSFAWAGCSWGLVCRSWARW